MEVTMNRKIRKDVETSCDYVLPDYMGDIKKLLSSKARVVPSGKYLSGDSVDVGGSVEYELLYADAEGRLTSLSTSSDYAFSLPTDGEKYVGCDADIAVANLSVRITGPRKVALKGALRGTFSVTEEGAPEVAGDVFSSDASPEVDTRVINSERYIYSEELEREYAEEAERLEGMAGEDVEVIASSAEIKILETRTVENGVEIRGELVIFAIVRTPEQPPFRIAKTVPFAETVSIGGTSPDAPIVATGCVKHVGVDVSEDGDDKILLASATVLVSAYAIENEPLEVVTDAYLTDACTASAYEELSYSTFLASHVTDVKVEQKVDAETLGTDNLHSIVWLCAEVRDFGCRMDAEGAKISGILQFNAIACEINADRSIGYIPIRVSAPFEHNVNISSQIGENIELCCTRGEPVCDFIIDGGTLVLRASLLCTLKESERGSVRRISELSATGEEVQRQSSVITVYYPSEGDTLFSVAKKYSTTVAKLSLDNPAVESVMAGEDISSLGRLIIK